MLDLKYNKYYFFQVVKYPWHPWHSLDKFVVEFQ